MRQTEIMLLSAVIFLILPIAAACYLYRLPIKGDYQFQLLWRGAAAGVVGQFIVTFLWVYLALDVNADGGAVLYVLLVFFPWLLFLIVIGMVFTFIIASIQKFVIELNALARSLVGGLIGFAGFLAWLFGLASKYSDRRLEKWFACMMIAIGIIAGLLCRPKPPRESETT